MQKTLTLLMAQTNPTVGAIEKNAEKIIQIICIHQHQHDAIVFPELALTGYPPEDLLLRPELLDRVDAALARIADHTTDCHVILGHPTKINGPLYNSASVFFQGERLAVYHKQQLPNFGVFDENRYFTPGPATPCLLTINGYRIGLCICEDIWQPGPVDQLIDANATLMICINASPFDQDKYVQREALLKTHAQRGLAIVYVNQVGGQDELVFDGQSLVLNHVGNVMARAPAFTEYLQTVTFNDQHITSEVAPLLERNASIYQALVCGLRDYVEKNHFPGVLLGLSGGIDSALTLSIAVDALGAPRVFAVMLPSRFTADISVVDALEQLHGLSVQHTTLPIEPAFNTLLTTLAPAFSNQKRDLTEENIQARIRGLLLMALSNKTGNMLLTTSNKSETAVGYATLYGDMCGGFSVLKDVLKTTVYALARYRNSISAVIPERVITRAPSAELAFNQTDQDSLPDYETLDAILCLYMEERLGPNEMIARGYEQAIVLEVIQRIVRNEYKRRQAAPGVKVTACAFDRDWRYPMTSEFF
ncbi:MAG TPA: NAD+ synthase [Legionella sp.]|nr:NAD+ synthase [Legionella sp.]